MTTETEHLETFLSRKRRVHDFDADYDRAERRLKHIKAPVLNYEVARRAVVRNYLVIRKTRGNAAFKSCIRQQALFELAQVKAQFKGLV